MFTLSVIELKLQKQFQQARLRLEVREDEIKPNEISHI